MNQRPAVLLYPALAVIGAALFYVIRSQGRSRTLLCEIHGRIQHSATRSLAAYRLL